ncbi:MAG: uracil-DNA glycosylase [Candidatus Sumerlaeaceae bacterium]|nr:uracil-DNA glycosylase [Candidatus Sumerlaeaceae bacterium]
MNSLHAAADEALRAIAQEISNCHRCMRLVAWRQAVATRPPRRFQGEEYWQRGVPGFGDPAARLLVIGLAPAAHGGNRTGRIFTGDRSGEWLFRALHRSGFASHPHSRSRTDAMQLRDCYITAVARCAPPQNRLLPEEIENCRPYLEREIELLWPNLRCVVVLGHVAFNWWKRFARAFVRADDLRSWKFAHGAEFHPMRAPVLLCSFHPSQQNTSTKRLTEAMFDAVWTRAKEIVYGEVR